MERNRNAALESISIALCHHLPTYKIQCHAFCHLLAHNQLQILDSLHLVSHASVSFKFSIVNFIFINSESISLFWFLWSPSIAICGFISPPRIAFSPAFSCAWPEHSKYQHQPGFQMYLWCRHGKSEWQQECKQTFPQLQDQVLENWYYSHPVHLQQEPWSTARPTHPQDLHNSAKSWSLSQPTCQRLSVWKPSCSFFVNCLQCCHSLTIFAVLPCYHIYHESSRIHHIQLAKEGLKLLNYHAS